MIDVRHLSISYEGSPVLTDMTFRVAKGTILGVVGAGGVGKSVLLKLLCGLIQPDDGDVQIDGLSIRGLDDDALADLRRRMGMLFQNYALFDFMTVGENVAFPLEQAREHSLQDIQCKVSERLSEVGLPGIERMYPRELSGGMKKRVSLARATIAGANILLYDDPAAGLDPVTSSKIFSLIRRLHSNEGVSVVVSHDIDRMVGVCDEWLVLHQGRIWFMGDVHAVRASNDPVIATLFDTQPQEAVR